MAWRGINCCFRLFILSCLTVAIAAASRNSGQVTFNGLPVPGATVTATRDEQKFATITDQQGIYFFPDLRDGTWQMQVDMFGFAAERQEVVVGPDASAAQWELKLLSLDQMKAEVQPAASAPVPPAPAPNEPKEPANTQASAPQTSEDDFSQRAADGFLINGSMNNGAASPFSQAAAFGNNRNGGKELYNGGIGVILDNSALDARPYSLTGQDTPKAAYNQMTGVATLGGPMQIPHLFKNGPNFFVGYQWTRNSNATTQSALMPDAAQRNGVFANPILDPVTGAPFPGNVIPPSRISPQAQALLNLYPLPNFAGNTGYNYQIPILSPAHQDALQSRLNTSLGLRTKSTAASRFRARARTLRICSAFWTAPTCWESMRKRIGRTVSTSGGP